MAKTPLPIPLSAVRAGERVAVRLCDPAGGVAARLHELGLHQGRVLEVIRNDGVGLILGLDGTRIGVARELASGVLVEELRG